MFALTLTSARARWLRIESSVTKLILVTAGFRAGQSNHGCYRRWCAIQVRFTGLQLLTSSMRSGPQMCLSSQSCISGATVAALRLERTTRRPDLTGYFRNKACLGKGRRSGARHSSTIYSFRFVRRQRLVPRRLSHLLLAPCAADVRKGHLSDKRSSP